MLVNVSDSVCSSLLNSRNFVFLKNSKTNNDFKYIIRKLEKVVTEKSRFVRSIKYDEYRHVTFLGFIESTSSLKITNVKKISSNTNEIPNISIIIRHKDELVNCFNISGDRNISIINSLKTSNAREISGIFVNIKENDCNSIPVFFITNISNIKNIRRLLPEITKTAKENASKILETGDVFEYIKKEIVSILGIQELSSSNQLNKSIDFAIYQAFSSGMLNGGTSSRLHGLISGISGAGKNYVLKTASLLNISYEEATASKMTVSGISAIGMNLKDKGGWYSTPGQIPLAHEGVFSCRDFHSISNNVSDGVMNIFSDVMQGGYFTCSDASKSKHIANTSILLDLNKKSDVKKCNVENFHDDIYDFPIHILSRMDFVIDINTEYSQQLKITKNIVNSFVNKRVNDLSVNKDLSHRIMMLKYVVASRKDLLSKVIFSEKSAKYIHHKLDKISDKFKTEETDLLSRISNSIIKFTKISACIRGSITTNKIDAVIAWSFVKEKLNIMKKVLGSYDNSHEECNIAKKGRVKFIIGKYFEERNLKVNDVVEKYIEVFRDEPGLSKSSIQRKIYRYIKNMNK